jgi:hypothetical protein
MRRDDLVCANCSGPVSEARCPVCRAARDQYGRGTKRFYAPLWLVLAILAAMIGAFALQARFA